jgi:hypothetical protein
VVAVVDLDGKITSLLPQGNHTLLLLAKAVQAMPTLLLLDQKVETVILSACLQWQDTEVVEADQVQQPRATAMEEVSSVTEAVEEVMAHLTAAGPVVVQAQADTQDEVLKVLLLAELVHRMVVVVQPADTIQVPTVYQLVVV